MMNYFRKVKLLGTQNTEEQVGPGPLFFSNPKWKHRNTQTPEKRGGTPWNHLALHHGFGHVDRKYSPYLTMRAQMPHPKHRKQLGKYLFNY